MKIVMMIAISMFFLAGCAEPKFEKGEIVCSVLNGQKGQVTHARPDVSSVFYNVRFAATSPVTDVNFLGPDDQITMNAFSEIIMEEFELKHCD